MTLKGNNMALKYNIMTLKRNKSAGHNVDFLAGRFKC